MILRDLIRDVLPSSVGGQLRLETMGLWWHLTVKCRVCVCRGKEGRWLNWFGLEVC